MKSRNFVKKTALWAAVILLAAAALTGCGRQTAQSHKEVRIFLSLNQMDTFRQTLVDAAAARAAQQGAQLTVEDAQGSIETQVAQIGRASCRERV